MSPEDDHTGHHVLPLKVYFTVAGLLLFLTLVTVLVSYFHFGEWNIVIAMAIAGVKAALVVLYFMHLKYDNRLYGLIFGTAIAFLAIFIALTSMDTNFRQEVYEYRGKTINSRAAIYDSTGNPIPMAQRTNIGPSSGGFSGQTAERPEEAPFEIRHGFGPIKEEVKVGPIDTVRALKGREIFESKCATCHRLDERYTGPPLRGVTQYRSPTFIMNQILDPTQNVSKHPDMQGLLKIYYTVMTNQNVTREDARTLVEYLRWEATRDPVPKK